MDRIHWVARCAYPGRSAFMFDSPAFVVDYWSDLETVAAEVVAEAWAKISPHPAPQVVEFVPGVLLFQSEER